MYLARFACGETQLVSAALRWTKPEGAAMGRDWARLLLSQTAFDFALRMEAAPRGCNVVLLLGAPAASEKGLLDFCAHLRETDPPKELAAPSTADEYDAMTGNLPPAQVRVDQRGYHHGGLAVACDFRLHTMFTSERNPGDAVYQVYLRPYAPGVEMERRVRKYLAWLDIEAPFSEPVRAMQRMLSQRLRQRGFLACEYLATGEAIAMESWQKRIRAHFEQTTGRIGFPEPPLETGEFTDFMMIGCHPTELEDGEPEIPALAATVFTEEETALVLSSDVALGRGREAAGAPGHVRPDVFISYASSDSAHAASACRDLEASGIVCWIAPRDVGRDVLPYPEAIARGISEARAVVVFVSDAANLSVHIPRELDLALERRLAIIPVRLSDVAPAGQLNYLLRTCQWLDAFGREFPAATGELVARLRRLLG